MQDMEIVRTIRDVVLPMTENPLFQPYFKPYQLCRSIEKRLRIQDEGIFVDEKTAQRVDELQQVQQEAAVKAQQAAQQAEAALLEVKALAEEAKAEMNRAKAEEHRGKGVLALAKAGEEGVIHPTEAHLNMQEADAHAAAAELARQQALQAANTPPEQPGGGMP
jgi:YesN/AraC family two-component response regulator